MMRIRKALSQDVEKISRIVCTCYEAFEHTERYPSDVVIELKRIRGSVDCIGRLVDEEDVFIVEEDGRISGMLSLRENEITKLYVDPERQRKGVGKMLFAYAESLVRSRGFQTLSLGAAGKTMIPFYERMGMQIAREHTIEHGPCVGMTVTILEKRLATE